MRKAHLGIVSISPVVFLLKVHKKTTKFSTHRQERITVFSSDFLRFLAAVLRISSYFIRRPSFSPFPITAAQATKTEVPKACFRAFGTPVFYMGYGQIHGSQASFFQPAAGVRG